MKIVYDTEKWVEIIQSLPKAMPIYASTYNVSKWKDNGYSHKILKAMEEHAVAHLIVGVPKFYPCIQDGDKGGCPSCYKQYTQKMKRLIKIVDEYPKIKIHFTKGVHTKFVVAGKYSIVGGRNISDSDILDLSFIINDNIISRQLVDQWETIRDSASYDVGNDGPLVFLYPYKGEMFANSKDINKEYRVLASERYKNDDVVDYWIKKDML